MRTAIHLLALLLAALTCNPAVCAAQPADAPPSSSESAGPALPDTPAGRHLAWTIDVLNGGEPGDLTERFTPEFLQQVTPDRFLALTRQLRAGPFAGKPVRFGGLRDGATALTATADLLTESGKFSLWVHVHEASGKVDGLLIRPPAPDVPRLGSYAELDAQLAQLPGKANCGVFRISGPADAPDVALLHGRDADSRLALGSTFKLYILGALAEEVEAGRARWDEPLAIRDDLKSLPSGDMQLQPAGAEFPLSHYADKMISISDNTATDHLLQRTGRERVEAYMARLHGEPSLNRPFLSTMEMFRIKLSDDRDLPAAYAGAGETQRREWLAPGGRIASTSPSLILASAWKKPVEVERVEWFASPRELATLMADLRRIEARPGQAEVGHALRINPGLMLDRQTWPGVAYKGGSEPGVLNGAWMLKRSDGAEFVVTLGWTNPDAGVDEARWAGLCTAAINLVARQ